MIFITNHESCAKEETKLSFCGMKKYETEGGDHFCIFNHDERERCDKQIDVKFAISKSSKLHMY